MSNHNQGYVLSSSHPTIKNKRIVCILFAYSSTFRLKIFKSDYIQASKNK